MKFCNCCKKTKPKSEYYNCLSRKDGLQFYCKICHDYKHNVIWRKNKNILPNIDDEQAIIYFNIASSLEKKINYEQEVTGWIGSRERRFINLKKNEL